MSDRVNYFYSLLTTRDFKVLVTQSCLTLWDCRLLCSSVHGILQTRILEWVAIPFSRGSSQSRDWTWVMHCRQIFFLPSAAAAKLLQSCPTLCNPIDSSPSGSAVPGILQAKTLEWAAISFSNACMHAKLLQSFPTLCNPMYSSPPGSPVHRII